MFINSVDGVFIGIEPPFFINVSNLIIIYVLIILFIGFVIVPIIFIVIIVIKSIDVFFIFLVLFFIIVLCDLCSRGPLLVEWLFLAMALLPRCFCRSASVYIF